MDRLLNIFFRLVKHLHTQTHTHTHPFNGPLSGTTWVSWYQKGKTNLDFTEARDSEWQWHQLGHMQVCTLLQTDNHASTPPLSFLQAGCPSCRPTDSVKALKATKHILQVGKTFIQILYNHSRTLLTSNKVCLCGYIKLILQYKSLLPFLDE